MKKLNVYNKTVQNWLLGQQNFCLTPEGICCPKPTPFSAKKNCCYPRSLSLTIYDCFQESENYIRYLINFDFCDVCFSNLTTNCNIFHRKEVQWWCGNVITRNFKSLIVSQNNLYGMYANFIVTFLRALDRASFLIC